MQERVQERVQGRVQERVQERVQGREAAQWQQRWERLARRARVCVVLAMVVPTYCVITTFLSGETITSKSLYTTAHRRLCSGFQ